MAAPNAQIAHRLRGRTRLRVVEKLGERGYFAEAERALSDCPSVTHVSGSALTASLLIVHSDELQPIAEFARERGIFELSASGEPTLKLFETLKARFEDLDEEVRARLDGRLGVPGLAFYGLLGASVLQIARGRVLPPATTLFFQALGVFGKALRQEQEHFPPSERAKDPGSRS